MLHGTETCYVHWKCRCARCRAAATEARRGRVKNETRVGRERGAATRFKWDVEHELAEARKQEARLELRDWLRRKMHDDPEYRQLIRQRVSAERKRRALRQAALKLPEAV